MVKELEEGENFLCVKTSTSAMSNMITVHCNIQDKLASRRFELDEVGYSNEVLILHFLSKSVSWLPRQPPFVERDTWRPHESKRLGG